ncbi:MAG TPA: tannase/feruloyl esterase family alpha/beta hydrolase [Bryobacteraceae bacterium]|jgi:feruloyl esterase
MMPKISIAKFASALFALAVPAASATCESLSTLTLPDTTITKAELVPAAENLPAHCRVAATLKPTADSDIKIEVWLPNENWNRKFLGNGNGNGGWTGSINPTTLATALRRNYATAMTDTGHEGGSASFAVDHPEKLIDFGYRATHEMTVKAKAIIEAFYGRAPEISYFMGCSAGGKQGLTEAQLFPTDYSGIISGAAANNWTHMMAQIIWVAQAVHHDDASYIPPTKYPAIHAAALAACDAKDGVKDGVIDDPTKCKFDPKVLACKGGDNPTCLTAAQVEAVRKIYTAPVNPRTKQIIYPGFEPGSELGWGQFVAGPTPTTFATDLFKYVVFKNPAWDYKTLNFDADIALADMQDNGTNNATDPNLKTFFEHGGKLLQYHGWADQLISPRNSIDYFQSVEKALGGPAKIKDNYRLFMVPGMSHCQGGEGTSSFDTLDALEHWVENGMPPSRIEASAVHNDKAQNGQPDRTRPLCPYPQVAVYNGKGSTDDTKNFTCKIR